MQSLKAGTIMVALLITLSPLKTAADGRAVERSDEG